MAVRDSRSDRDRDVDIVKEQDRTRGGVSFVAIVTGVVSRSVPSSSCLPWSVGSWPQWAWPRAASRRRKRPRPGLVQAPAS
jgi:hypothetical protein